MKQDNQPEKALDLLVNTSWEVCNKIGGIYAVLSTQADTLQKIYKDRVIYVGPDVWLRDGGPDSPYFKADDSVLKTWAGRKELPFGISVRVGRWDIPGHPIAILVNFDSMYAVKDQFYGKMWQLYGVDSLHAYGDYDEACAFSHAAGIVVESLYDHFSNLKGRGAKKGPINAAAHFHEWTTGMGLLYIKDACPAIATLFTTHATSIGRSICGNGKPLYDYLKGYDGDQMARELNMESKHSLEKTAAHQADCFTTVSEITAMECEQLLQRRPDIVTPNGFEKGFVPAKTRFAAARKRARQALIDVAQSLTGCKIVGNPFLIATSGRCEYRNKGIDLFLDVMATLRSRKGELERQVVAFVMVPAWVNAPRQDLRTAIDEQACVTLPDPVITHSLHNMDSDPIIGRIHGLTFQQIDPSLMVIYVPCYLDGHDGIFNGFTYYDLLIGMDATVFPSYYEPWGYTPLESIAFGVPTVTTSLSGFGQWILTSADSTFEETGVNVAGRGDSNYPAVVDSISRSLRFLVNTDEASRKEIASAAMATSDRASWSRFIKYYTEAYSIAEHHRDKRMNALQASGSKSIK
ncbi:MAG: glycosyltransferase [Pseudoflavonifractor sp.]|nr:glycosyltransferase [Pseudoflavonifractor sp.]